MDTKKKKSFTLLQLTIHIVNLCDGKKWHKKNKINKRSLKALVPFDQHSHHRNRLESPDQGSE